MNKHLKRFCVGLCALIPIFLVALGTTELIVKLNPYIDIITTTFVIAFIGYLLGYKLLEDSCE